METQASPRLLAAAASNRTEAQARLSMFEVISNCAKPAPRVHDKPCPWCAADILPPRKIANRFVAGCENPDCWVSCEAAGSTPEEALKLWNGRA